MTTLRLLQRAAPATPQKQSSFEFCHFRFSIVFIQGKGMSTSSTAELGFSESDQIKLVLNGDADAFCKLIRPHRQLLYCKAVSIVRQEADAEEIVQNVMWKAFRSLAGFRQECQLRTWLI